MQENRPTCVKCVGGLSRVFGDMGIRQDELMKYININQERWQATSAAGE